MRELVLKNDKYKMNWIEGGTEWGTVRTPEGIKTDVVSEKRGDIITEKYTFTNTASKDIFTSLTDISIYTPFNDDYPDAQTCMTQRCHMHVWCGGDVSYVMALRMGGEPPHLGLVLTAGSIGGYSIERDIKRISNDRGDLILHPSPVHLTPGGSFSVEWTLFDHDGADDFYEKLKIYSDRYIDITAENYVVFENETAEITVTPSFDFGAEDVLVTDGGRKAGVSVRGGKIYISEKPGIGEHIYNISVCGVKTRCAILVLPELSELAKRRCRFIAEKQQCMDKNSALYGAYLAYDNEEEHLFYSSESDYNGGRERIGMGVLTAKYLQRADDKLLEESLEKYTEYIMRELFDCETGVVYNDCGRDNSWNRLYNYPWMSLYFAELYCLYNEKKYLVYAFRALKSFYEQGGERFYAIAVPLRKLTGLLKKAGMNDEADILFGYFEKHCAYIMDNGTAYPAHEVNYEQSIVAPAADLLIQMYLVTKNEKYLDGAKKQLRVLELFNGRQPDHHLYETAIRHWDGYWFGKRKMYGDTFPHYWSALSGNVFGQFAETDGGEGYTKRAEASHRGVLSLITPDGRGSAAYVHPVSVNGQRAGYYDPYANDQDWALYFMLRSAGEN